MSFSTSSFAAPLDEPKRKFGLWEPCAHVQSYWGRPAAPVGAFTYAALAGPGEWSVWDVDGPERLEQGVATSLVGAMQAADRALRHYFPDAEIEREP